MKRYITIDGGTTNTRISMVCDGNIVTTLKMNLGARSCGENIEEYKSALKCKIEEIIDKNQCSSSDVICVIASGMITSELGLFPLEHLVVPVGISELNAGMVETAISDVTDIPFVFIRGIKTSCENLECADMMRGEEAETIGVASENDDDCIYMLMGSHSKIIKTDENGRIVSFSTMLTGELTESVANHTILKNSVVFTDEDADIEYLKKGYEYCKKRGINETLFKTRILKNLFGESDNAVYSFFMGAILCGEIEYVLKENPKKVVVGGNKKLRETVSVLLDEYFNGKIVCLSDERVEKANAMGMVKIFEYDKNIG